MSARRTARGEVLHPNEYVSWGNARSRCFNPRNADYANYGGRGISMCLEWTSFENFFRDMGERPEGTTLDRIDNDGNYEPRNCRWATNAVNQLNRGNVHRFTINGETKSICGWAKHFGLTESTVYRRVVINGVPIEVALTVKPGTVRRWRDYRG